jgi:hypothetical protein
MYRPDDWMRKAMRLIPMLHLERHIDELFDCGLITFDLPEGL